MRCLRETRLFRLTALLGISLRCIFCDVVARFAVAQLGSSSRRRQRDLATQAGVVGKIFPQ
jgi:hypothetical protein